MCWPCDRARPAFVKPFMGRYGFAVTCNESYIWPGPRAVYQPDRQKNLQHQLIDYARERNKNRSW